MRLLLSDDDAVTLLLLGLCLAFVLCLSASLQCLCSGLGHIISTRLFCRAALLAWGRAALEIIPEMSVCNSTDSPPASPSWVLKGSRQQVWPPPGHWKAGSVSKGVSKVLFGYRIWTVERMSLKERMQHLCLLRAGSSAEGTALLHCFCLLLGGCSLRTGALCSQGGASLKARKLPRALWVTRSSQNRFLFPNSLQIKSNVMKGLLMILIRYDKMLWGIRCYPPLMLVHSPK